MFKILVVFLIFGFFIVACYGESCTWEEDKLCASSKYVNGVVGATYNPGLKYGVATAKQLSKSTQAGIVTSSGKWLVRMDLPHGKTKFPHININPVLTKKMDPHIHVPKELVTAAGAANSVIRNIADGVGYAAIAVNGYSLYTAKSEERPKIVSSMFGGYAGAYGGAYAGSSIGGWIGGGIGAIFGGVGAVPGTAIGSMIGGFIGGMTGSHVGREIGEEMAS